MRATSTVSARQAPTAINLNANIGDGASAWKGKTAEMDVQAQEVGKTDACPCGSGKAYEDCCEKSGITYGLFRFDARKVVFNVEEANRAVQDVLSFLCDEVSDPFKKGATLDVEDALGKLYNTFERFEKSLAPFSKASSCKKGCTACCHHIVETSPIEAEAVRRFVETRFDRSEKMALLARIDKHRHNYPKSLALDEEYEEGLRDAYFEKRVPCPFLSAEASCMVYASRPLVCRTYMVFSDPKQCMIGDGMAVYEADYIPEVHRASLFLSLLTFRDLRITRHLPDWLINEFRIIPT